MIYLFLWFTSSIISLVSPRRQFCGGESLQARKGISTFLKMIHLRFVSLIQNLCISSDVLFLSACAIFLLISCVQAVIMKISWNSCEAASVFSYFFLEACCIYHSHIAQCGVGYLLLVCAIVNTLCWTCFIVAGRGVAGFLLLLLLCFAVFCFCFCLQCPLFLLKVLGCSAAQLLFKNNLFHTFSLSNKKVWAHSSST